MPQLRMIAKTHLSSKSLSSCPHYSKESKKTRMPICTFRGALSILEKKKEWKRSRKDEISY